MNDQANSKTLVIEWFRNGTVSKVMEVSDHGCHVKSVEYDESGNIIKEYER